MFNRLRKVLVTQIFPNACTLSCSSMLQLLIYPVDEVLLPAEEQPLIFTAVQLNAGNKVGAAGVQS